MGDTAAELLASLKEKAASNLEPGNYTAVLLVQEDASLRKLVSVWPNVMLPRDPKPNEVVPDGMRPLARLGWLWARIDPDPIPDWLQLAGLPDAPHTRRLCRVAIDNRMVLPDGTLSPQVKAWLNALVNASLAPALAVVDRERRDRERRNRDRDRQGDGGGEPPTS